VYVVRDARGIAPNRPIATVIFRDTNGVVAKGEMTVEAELRREACRLGADGIILDDGALLDSLLWH
jgi:hypothetical protein